ncbi:MAG: SUMF1/EgtB/PvdO family nonheme iron enzyme [Hormoscilla sp. GUM202]|nr:SUMF1/EgtB/PvdO family nonheme iron enzyme [Hormoscilla sp. GUM202]
MIYCLNPNCLNPQNPDNHRFCQSCGAKLIPQLLNRFAILERLGEGGFGKTYRATDGHRMNANSVVKQFAPAPEMQQAMRNNPQLRDKMLELFEREASQLLELGQHPQIPTLFAYFQADLQLQTGTYPYLYLAQEYVEGENLLQALIQKQSFDEAEVRSILADLLPILELIHSRKVIHRDIKPENIMRRQSDGRLVLIDFGVSKQATGTSIPPRSTVSTMGSNKTIAGTPGYAPPEQMLYGKAYPASDLYALGATCIHLLTGENPLFLFEPMDSRWLWQESLQRQGKYVSPQLTQVIEGLLGEKPKDRYQSATEVLAALNSSVSSPPNASRVGTAGTAHQQPSAHQPSRANITNQANPQSNANTLPTFEFEVVIIDKGGREISRSRLRAEFYREDLGNGVILEMISIPGGKFTIGSPESETGRKKTEGPQREVTVSPFFMGKFPITQAQWQAVISNNPSHFKGANRPVECVGWDDAVEFCQRLSRKTRKSYRLPSEAEWEYACRAGTTTPFHFGETITADLANYNGNKTYGNAPKGSCGKQTTPVGYFQVANNFGLYDMHGLVWEWCADPWHETYRGIPADGSTWEFGGDDSLKMLRGGSWLFDPAGCRSACRARTSPGDRRNYCGLRVVVGGAVVRTP